MPATMIASIPAGGYKTFAALKELGATSRGIIGAAISKNETLNLERAAAGYSRVFGNIAEGSKWPLGLALAGGALVASNTVSTARDRPITTGLAAGAGALTAMHYGKPGWKGAAVGAAAWAMFG